MASRASRSTPPCMRRSRMATPVMWRSRPVPRCCSRVTDSASALFGSGYPGSFGGAFRPGAGSGVQFDLSDLFGGGGGGGLGDLLGGVFGGRRVGPRRGSDVETEATIDFVDAARGVTVPLRM